MESADSETRAPSLTPPPRTRKPSRLIAGLVVSVISVVLLTRGLDWSEVGQGLRDVDWTPLYAAVALGALGMVVQGVRTRWLMDAAGGPPLKQQVFAHYLAFVGNALVPFRVGEFLRIDYLARQSGAPHSRVLGVAALERVLDMAFMLLCFGLAVVLSAGRISATWGIVTVAGGALWLLGSFVLLGNFPALASRLSRALLGVFGERVRRMLLPRIEAFIHGLSSLMSLGRVLRVSWLTALRWSLALVNFQLYLMACGVDVPWFAPLLMLSFLAFGTMIPSSVAFVGTYHYAAVAALGLLGVDRAAALPVAVVCHAVSFLPPSIIGGVWIAVQTARGGYHQPAEGKA